VLLIGLAMLWLAIVLGGLGLFAALANGWQPELLRGLVEWTGREVLHRDVRIGRIEGTLLDELIVHDIVIAPLLAEGRVSDPTETLQIDRLALRIEAGPSALNRALVLRSATIDGARLRLHRNHNGRWILAGLSDPRPRPADAPRKPLRVPVSVSLRELVVHDGRIELSSDPRSGLEDVRLDLEGRAIGLAWRPRRDPEWPEDLRVAIGLHRGSLGGMSLGSGVSEWTLAGNRLGLEALAVSGPVGGIIADGEALLGGSLLRPRLLETVVQLRLVDVDLSTFETAQELPSSHLSAELDVRLLRPEGEAAESFLEVDASLQPSSIMTGTLSGGELRGHYVIGSGRWAFDEAYIAAAAGRVTASGSGQRGHFDALELSTRDLDLAKLPAAWSPLPEARGRINLDAELSGSALDPVGWIGITGAELGIEALGPAELHLELTALGDRRYRIDVLQVKIDEEAPQMAGAYLRSERPAALRFDQHRDVLVLEIDDLALAWSGGALELSGGVRGGRLLPTHVDVESLDLDVVAALAGMPRRLGGVVSGTIDLGGDPFRPEMNAELLWRNPLMQGLEAERVELGIVTSEERLRLDARVIQADQRELHMTADIPIDDGLPEPRALLADPRASFGLRARGFDLAWLDPVLVELPWRGSGIIDGDLEAVGAAPIPNVVGDLYIRGARVHGLPVDTPGTEQGTFGPINGMLSFRGNALRLDGLQLGDDAHAMLLSSGLAWQDAGREFEFDVTLQGVGFHGRLEASGGTRDGVFRPTTLEVFDFEVEELAAIWDIELDIAGDLSARLELEGPLEYPDAKLEARWERPRFGRNQSDRVELNGRIDSNGLAIDGAFTRFGRREIAWSGWRPLDRGRPLHTLLLDRDGWLHDVRNVLILEANHFDLGWLALLVPDLPLKSQGRVNGHVQLRGSRPIPAIYGELELEQGIFSIANQRAKIGRLDGIVRLGGFSAELPHLRMESHRGFAEISGNWDWSDSGIGVADFEVNFDNYLFNQLGLLRTYVDGQLTATGPLDAMNVGGRIELNDVRVSFPSPEDPILKEIRVRGLPDRNASASIYEQESEIAGLDTKTAVDVTFALTKGTWVRGMGLDAEIVGEVQVTKAPYGELHYRGTLEVEEGRYSLQGKRFDLEYGTAIFTGDPRPIPDVDIVGVRQASRDVRVTVHLTGPANQPQLELFSDPPMDTAEIISYIYLGRGRDGNGTSSNSTEQLSAAAASMAGVMLVDSLAPELRETLRIDQISVTSGETDEAPAVEIESQITPEVYLRLIQSLGATGDEAVEVRWRFWRGLSLKSRVKRTGASSIDLLWEFDYWGLERHGLGGLRPGPLADSNSEGCLPPLRCPEPAGEEASSSTE
jgi:hypothetical protein